MAYECILVDRDGPYTTITMNRPQRRNALSQDHLEELTAAFEEAADTDARGIILAGNGPVFSAGHDFADVVDADYKAVRDLLLTCTKLMQTIQAAPQVVVAKVHALATAAGCQLVATCDLAVASTAAAFATPGGKGGWFCHTPMVAVARNVGRKRAMEMALSGDRIDAETAYEWGLVNSVAAPDDLDKAALELLDRCTQGSPRAKALGKQTLYAQFDRPERDAYSIAIEVMAGASQTPQAREGMHAFLEKRPPVWPA